MQLFICLLYFQILGILLLWGSIWNIIIRILDWTYHFLYSWLLCLGYINLLGFRMKILRLTKCFNDSLCSIFSPECQLISLDNLGILGKISIPPIVYAFLSHKTIIIWKNETFMTLCLYCDWISFLLFSSFCSWCNILQGTIVFSWFFSYISNKCIGSLLLWRRIV